MDSQDIQQINGRKLMNYKRLFWGYVTLNVVWGFVYGIYLGTKEIKTSNKISDYKMSDKMQEMVNHYSNKEKVA